MDLSLILRLAPSAVAEMPYKDCILLLERHYEQEHARVKLEATLHGMQLK